MTGSNPVQIRADALAATARQIVDDLDLMPRLSAVGEPVLVGSAAAGLMAVRDIDVNVRCPSAPDIPSIFAVAQALFQHPRVKRVTVVDETGPFQTVPGLESAGIYCGLRYHEGGTLAGEEWRIDIWFLLPGAALPEIAMRDRLLAAGSDERAAILEIKHGLVDAGRYGNVLHGIDIYRAVLDEGVRTLAEFDALP